MSKTAWVGVVALTCVGMARASERTIPVEEFRDRMMGAWLGQSVGVAYGAPTEFRHNGTIIPAEKMPVWKPELVNNTFQQDDLYVEMTFIDTLIRRGFGVTTRAAGIDFANSAYRLWCANSNARNNLRNGIAAPASSHPKFHRTTDDIDYQIEADFSGILAPGLPQAAVDFGETFGRIMNYGDGLYAGQFVGALYAEAYFETDRIRLVEKALKAIPSESKYAGMVRDMLAWHRANPTCWQATWTNAVEKYFRTKENLGRVSSAQINVKINGAMVLLGLLYGEGNMDRTMYVSTAGGFDSDCNPSSACGVLGTMIGFKKLEAKYFSKFDRKKKWEFTDFTWDGLIAASDRLVRGIVVKYGGRIEKDAAGAERFVLPTVEARPSPFCDSSKPGPVPADERLSEEERSEIRYLPCGQGAQSSRPGDWPGFSRGMGIGGWLTNYKRFNVLPVEKRLTLTDGDFAHFDTYITEGDVERIKRWGFDHIRLGFDQIVLEEKPGVWRERTFRKIDDFIGWCGKHKVNVVLNLHKAIGNYCDIPEKVQLLDDAALQERFIALWIEIERRYHGFPGLAFEILNEVRDVDPEKWNALADRTIKAIREKNPDRWIVVGSTCWNDAGHLKQLKVWDDPKVVYTFHMYNPFMFTHQRGVLQAGPLYANVDVPYPGRAEVERCLAPAAEWKKAHPDKILWNGEFGTIRHMQPIARADYMRDVIGFCKRAGIPYCVWNYLSTPNDGNRFSLVDDDTRDFLSDELLRACLGLGDKAAEGELKYITFNIWGPYFGNPVCERDLKIAAFLEREGADLVGLQECEKEFWSSRLFTRLGKAGYGWIADGKDLTRDLNPLLYRKDRLELLESGVELFRKEDNPQGTKGFSWGVFRDRATGRKFFAYSTHFWWRTGKGETYRKNEAMRVGNVRELLAKCDEVSKRHGELPIVGGGDLNSTLILRNASLGKFGTLGLKDAQFTVEGASPWSSHHGNPQRDALGNLRPFFRPGSDNPSNSLDHVHYRGVMPIALRVDRTQDVLECSDHSPVVFTFKLK